MIGSTPECLRVTRRVSPGSRECRKSRWAIWFPPGLRKPLDPQGLLHASPYCTYMDYSVPLPVFAPGILSNTVLCCDHEYCMSRYGSRLCTQRTKSSIVSRLDMAQYEIWTWPWRGCHREISQSSASFQCSGPGHAHATHVSVLPLIAHYVSCQIHSHNKHTQS